MFQTLRWEGDRDGVSYLVEQTWLPDRYEEIEVATRDAMIDAIRRLAVRGAPAIGVAAAYAVCLSTRGMTDSGEIGSALEQAFPAVAGSRPTAVNLFHMVDRMKHVAQSCGLDGLALRDRLLEEAKSIHREDEALCLGIGQSGAHLVPEGGTVLTHCNAGALATAGRGTALAVFYAAHEAGRKFRVIADETRPLLQGARLTAWELQQAKIPVTLICDNAAAHLFQRGEIDLVITGSDRVAANGDAANKIGTYGVACLAARHGVPFYIAAPSTTFDFGIENGMQIPIEERDPSEVWGISGSGEVPKGIDIRNPAFDVTPHELIHGWITEKGVLQPPFNEIR